MVRRGPYCFVRHPGYLGAFLTYGSTPLFFHAWTAMLPSVAILLLAFLRRMHYEEKELLAAMGADYADYCKYVRRFIPGLW